MVLRAQQKVTFQHCQLVFIMQKHKLWTNSLDITPQLFNTIEHVAGHQYFSNFVFSNVVIGLPSCCPKNTIAYVKLIYANLVNEIVLKRSDDNKHHASDLRSFLGVKMSDSRLWMP